MIVRSVRLGRASMEVPGLRNKFRRRRSLVWCSETSAICCDSLLKNHQAGNHLRAVAADDYNLLIIYRLGFRIKLKELFKIQITWTSFLFLFLCSLHLFRQYLSLNII